MVRRPGRTLPGGSRRCSRPSSSEQEPATRKRSPAWHVRPATGSSRSRIGSCAISGWPRTPSSRPSCSPGGSCRRCATSSRSTPGSTASSSTPATARRVAVAAGRRTFASSRSSRRPPPTSTLAVVHRDQLERGFRRLPPEQRAVFVFHHYLGLTLPETADQLERAPGHRQVAAALRHQLDPGRHRGGQRPAPSLPGAPRMTTDHDVDRITAALLADGPAELADNACSTRARRDPPDPPATSIVGDGLEAPHVELPVPGGGRDRRPVVGGLTALGIARSLPATGTTPTPAPSGLPVATAPAATEAAVRREPRRRSSSRRSGTTAPARSRSRAAERDEHGRPVGSSTPLARRIDPVLRRQIGAGCCTVFSPDGHTIAVGFEDRGRCDGARPGTSLLSLDGGLVETCRSAGRAAWSPPGLNYEPVAWSHALSPPVWYRRGSARSAPRHRSTSMEVGTPRRDRARMDTRTSPAVSPIAAWTSRPMEPGCCSSAPPPLVTTAARCSSSTSRRARSRRSPRKACASSATATSAPARAGRRTAHGSRGPAPTRTAA